MAFKILSYLLILGLITKFVCAELANQCTDFCTQQIVTDEDDFDLVCNKTCKLHECKIGCQKWFTFSNLLTCPQICERKKSGQPLESIYCNIGCNQALRLYVNKTRSKLRTPSAPYLVGDSLRNDSLILQWKTSTLDFNISYLIQFRYSQLNSDWIYYKPNNPVRNGQLLITNLYPFTAYKFRVAWYFLDSFKLNQNNQFEEILGFYKKLNSSLKEFKQNTNKNFIEVSILDEIEPVFSEESVEIRTLPYGLPSLPPKIENCVSISPNKVLLNYKSPEFINGELISYSLVATSVNENSKKSLNSHQIVRDLKVEEDHLPKSSSINYVLNSLLPNSTYLISLSAVNREGTGPAAKIYCHTLPSNGKTIYKQLFSNKKNTQLEKQDEDPKLVLATKKLILIKKSTNFSDPVEILFRLEDFHYGENFTSLAVHVAKNEIFTSDTAGNLRRIDINGKFRKILSFNSQNLYGNLFTNHSINLSKLISSGLLQVKISCLTVDWLNDKLYFVRRTILNMPRNYKISKPDQRFNSYHDFSELIEIMKSNLDGTDLQTVIRFDFGELPVKLKVDPYNGFLFWSAIINYHNHAQISKMILDLDDIISSPENNVLIEKFLNNQMFKDSSLKLKSSIFKIDLAFLNTNHTISSARASKLVTSNNDPSLLQFTISPSELKLYYLKQGELSTTMVSISLDGNEVIDIRSSNVENSHFKVNLKNLALFNRTFFWTLLNETFKESYHEAENKYYHNVIYMDTKMNDLSFMELMHPIIQQTPIPLNTINNLQALFLNTDVKIKWQSPSILPEVGIGSFRRWNYELCIMEMHSNFSISQNTLTDNNSINPTSFIEDEKYLKKRICFDIKDQFCNLGQLKMNTTYIIKVRAVSTSAPGPWSSIFIGQTLIDNKGDINLTTYKKSNSATPYLLLATEDGLVKSNLIGESIETLLQTNSIGKNYIKDIAWYQDEIYISLGNSSVFHFKKNKWAIMGKVNGASTIAIDWLTPKLYFSNDVQQTISRCNLDGSQFETLPIFSNVKELVLDSNNALMYWSVGHSIEVATFNALYKQKYFQVGLFSEKQIVGLTIDFKTNKLIFYVKSFEKSLLYSGNLLKSNQVLNGLIDIDLKLISSAPINSVSLGPINIYSNKILWLNNDHQVTVTDYLGKNPSIMSNLKNVHNLQFVHPSLQPLKNLNLDQFIVTPDSIDKSTIDINGSSNNFTISWQNVKNVNYGEVFYELILENRERNIELHLNQTSYTYPDSSNQLALPVFKISIKAYTFWSCSKRIVIVLKFNNQLENLENIAPAQNKIIYLEPPKKPTLLKINRKTPTLYEMTWTSSNVNYLNYLNNKNLEDKNNLKANNTDENLIIYCIFKKSITSDKWQLVYNGTDTKAIINFEANEFKKTNLIKLIAFNRYGESEPVNHNLNPSLDDLENNGSFESSLMLLLLGLFVTLGIAGIILFYWTKFIAEQSHEKKQLQFSKNHNELATLSNYPIGIKKQNDNQLYQNTDFSNLTFLKNIIQVSRPQILMKKLIGSGAFGEVYEGLVTYNNNVAERVAVKTLKNKTQKKEFLKEAQLMNTFKHPHILQLKGICLTNEPMFLLLEFMNKGDLSCYLRSNRPTKFVPSSLNVSDLIEMAIQIAKGCVYLEEKNYVHRDLAARNCLVGVDRDVRTVKIGDFGLTRDIYKNDYYQAGKDALLPIRWMPPESITDGFFTTQSDVWSYGIILWEIFTLGQRPYYDTSNIMIAKLVCEGERLEKPDTCPDELFNLMLKCWSKLPEERPSFAYCLDSLLEIKDIIKISSLNQQITSVHNQSYVLNSITNSNQSAETLETTLSTVASPFMYNKKAGLVDVKSLSLIKQEDMTKPYNSQIKNYDCPDPRTFSVNSNYVNNNHIKETYCLKDKDGYELPVKKTFLI